MEAEREVADLREDLIKAEQRTRLQLLRTGSPFEGAPVPERSVHSITSLRQGRTQAPM